MKNHVVLGAIGMLALAPVAATAQTTDTEPTPEAPAVKATTTKGKTVSFKGGKLRVTVGKKSVDYIVDKATDCGYSLGQMGDSMRCSNLSQKKYLAKPVRVTWYTDAKKRRVATLVALDLSKK